MDLLAAIAGQPPILRGLKRRSDATTADPTASSAGLTHPSCEYTVGLWMASPLNSRTVADEFGILITEAFLSNEAAAPTLPAYAEADLTAEAPLAPERRQWEDVPCPSCRVRNWHWRHCCRSCGKDSTGYRHWLSKCTCEGCAAERGLIR
jgi:hypothetical protein